MDYEIHENVSFSKFEEKSYVSGTREINIAGNNLNTKYSDYNETSITEETCYRLRLSYDDVKTGTDNTIVFKNSTGVEVKKYENVEVVSTAGKTQAEIDELYTKGQKDAAGDYHPVIIKETGELILPKGDYNTVVTGNAASVEITYHKSDWQKGDPRPEHYFMCKDANNIEYNYNRVDADGNPTTSATNADGSATTIQGFQDQAINYEIAYNQTIQINTNASNTFSHDIGRDIDDLINITQQVITAEANTTTVKEAYENETNVDKKAKYKTLLDAVEKQETLLKDQMHDMYTNAISRFKSHAEVVNNEISKIGALTSRLELTKNRIKDQSNNVKQIADDNINADLTETAIDYKSAQLALEAAEMAAGKIANQTLLNFL